MNLIADSGSTKTSWVLFSEDSSPLFIHTQGINPIHQDEETVKGILQKELMPQLSGRTIDEIFFYGTGVRPTEEALMQRLLQEVTGVSRVEAKSDLLGAARALCGHDEGLACILGTGSNSCLFDGHRIVMNTSPLGYILGRAGTHFLRACRQSLHHLNLNVAGRGFDIVIIDLWNREFQHIRSLNVRHLAEHLHEFGEIIEAGKAGFQPVIRAFRRKLQCRDSFSEGGRPCVKVL